MCAILTRRTIIPKSIIRRIRQGSHGLVSIDSIDVQALTTALFSVPKPARFRPGSQVRPSPRLLILNPQKIPVLPKNKAGWLEKVLAEEHERDKKHADRVELPD